MLPDLDVIGFRLGMNYADQFGHRGATHSLMAAFLTAATVTVLMCPVARRLAFIFLCLAVASHGLLDMLTDGGLGVALLWPFDLNRHFFPFTPIRVSPIGTAFLSARG
ncbi:MAG: hypothetical protein RL367_2034, partial [Pseudomonadota bacterium]